MSVTGLSSSDPPSTLFHKPIHHRNDSDELDVFEAAKYFSGYNEPIPHYYTTTKNRAPSGAARMSLDMPMANSRNSQILEEKDFNIRNGKPHKQPSSPGGRLASFLNTLFHQAAKKNKKKPPKSVPAAEEEDEITPAFGDGARRRRRSSISHFTRSFADTRSWYSTTSSKSGFRTPPPLSTPTKAGFRTVVCGQNQKPVCTSRGKLGKLSHDGLFSSGSNQKSKVGGGGGCKLFGGDYGDDGGESDSSSDLFELQNYDLDAYSSGLPVYETTDVGRIRSGNSAI